MAAAKLLRPLPFLSSHESLLSPMPSHALGFVKPPPLRPSIPRRSPHVHHRLRPPPWLRLLCSPADAPSSPHVSVAAGCGTDGWSSFRAMVGWCFSCLQDRAVGSSGVQGSNNLSFGNKSWIGTALACDSKAATRWRHVCMAVQQSSKSNVSVAPLDLESAKEPPLNTYKPKGPYMATNISVERAVQALTLRERRAMSSSTMATMCRTGRGRAMGLFLQREPKEAWKPTECPSVFDCIY